jgi:hypothetical protein
VGFVLAERVLYIPSVGFCLLVAIGFQRALHRCTYTPLEVRCSPPPESSTEGSQMGKMFSVRCRAWTQQPPTESTDAVLWGSQEHPPASAVSLARGYTGTAWPGRHGRRERCCETRSGREARGGEERRVVQERAVGGTGRASGVARGSRGDAQSRVAVR